MYTSKYVLMLTILGNAFSQYMKISFLILLKGDFMNLTKKKQKPYQNIVFWSSVSFISIVVIFGALFPNTFASIANRAFQFTTDSFGWFYLIAVLSFICFQIGLAFSKYGKVKLGPKNAEPDYSFYTWIGMLISCGLGIGLVFYGIAEPMSHFFTSPFNGGETTNSEAARTAMGYSFFHWGISQWAIFSLVGLAVGYFQFRKKEDGLISTTLKPIIQKRRGSKILRKVIDISAVIATAVGVATSLGLGIMQINGGLNHVFGINNNVATHLIIIGIMLVLYLASSLSGLNRGIKWLSNINLTLMFLLMFYIFFSGPTVFILDIFVQGIGDYIHHFIEYSLRLSPYTENPWVKEWTIFYWAWTIAWSPFVGAFIGRISRGRTIREFITGVMIVPPLICILWIAIFGGTAIHMDLFQGTNIASAVNENITSALFTTFGEMPFSFIISVIAIILVFLFLITSADSASYILGTMTTNGMQVPPLLVRAIWGILIAAIAAVLTIASGLEGLQTASLVVALPFTVILLLMARSIWKQIHQDEQVQKNVKKKAS